ncbi:MAG: helix-turn-helix domain-containing protein [Chloroflexota bacterium]
MIRVQLSPDQREELQQRTREWGLSPQTRERLEMIRLADTGWNIPKIARYLGRQEATVRKYIKSFLAEGFDALPDRPRPGRPKKVTEEHLKAVEKLIDESKRTFTAPQLVKWLQEEHRVHISTDRLSRLLKQRRYRWKRTKRSVAHKRKDPNLQAAKEAELEVIKKSGPKRRDRLVLSG